MKLAEKQALFATAVARLILQANDMGYAVTFGETYRSPEEARRLAAEGKGIIWSLHTKRLAVDLNLFKNGKYLTESEDYKELGEWWEGQSYTGVKCCWGGRFYDGNHFSFEHDGRK